MLVFIDESGDTGRKLNKGSSKFFVISMIVFDDNKIAELCDKEIDKLRKDLNLKLKYEFHFSNNSDKVKLKFLEIINKYQFMYFSVVIDKDPKKLWGPGFKDKESFYKYSCSMVITNAMQYLSDAIVILDRSGNPVFRNRLAKYLNQKINFNKKIIKKIKQQNSKSNNLLQLADYITGIVNRKQTKGKNWQLYYKYIRAKEFSIQIWPK